MTIAMAVTNLEEFVCLDAKLPDGHQTTELELWTFRANVGNCAREHVSECSRVQRDSIKQDSKIRAHTHTRTRTGAVFSARDRSRDNTRRSGGGGGVCGGDEGLAGMG